MDATHYGIDVRWSARDGAFLATCPSFPRLSAYGDTREEALREGEVVLSMYLEEYEEQGVPVPEPVEAIEYSGQTRLRLPKSTHRALAMRAEEEGVSMNQLAVALIERGLGSDQVTEIHRRVAAAAAHLERHMLQNTEAVRQLQQEVVKVADHNVVFSSIALSLPSFYLSEADNYSSGAGGIYQDPLLNHLDRQNQALDLG